MSPACLPVCRVSRLSSVSPRCCDAGSGPCLPVSPSRCDAGSGLVSACLPVSPSLCGQMLDAVTLAPGSCLPLVSLCVSCLPLVFLCLPCVSDAAPGSCFPLVFLSPGSGSCLPCLPGQMLDAVTPAPGLSPACLVVSPSLVAGSRVVSPACLAVSPSLRGQMPDAVTPGLSPACLPVSDAGSVVSPACLPVSPRCCDAARGSCLPLVSLCVVSPACLPVSAVRC